MAQSFWQGMQQTMGAGAQIGASAASDARKAKQEQLKSIASMFVQAVQTPGPQGEQLFTGVMAAMGVPPERWEEQVKIVRNLDETKRAALAALASGKDLEANMPHIIAFLGQAGVEMAEKSKSRRADERLRARLFPGSASGTPNIERPLGAVSRGGGRFGDILSGVRAGAEEGALSGRESLKMMLDIEKARGQDPRALLDMFNQLGAGRGGAPGALGVPTLSIGPSGTTLNIDPTRRHPLDVPLSPSQAKNFRIPLRDSEGNVLGFQTLPPGASPREARRMGAELTPDKSELAGAGAMVKSFEEIVLRLFPSRDDDSGIINRGKRGAAFAKRFFQQAPGDEDVTIYNDQMNGTLSIIVRALGEKGTLTNQDIDRVRRLFPRLWPLADTSAVARQKMERLKGIIEKIQQGDAAEVATALGIGQEPARSKGGAVYVSPDGTQISIAQIRRRALKEKMTPDQIIEKYGLRTNAN